jgi:adenylosuccinate synthase
LSPQAGPRDGQVESAGAQGVVARLSVSRACPLILPYHSALDLARELKGKKIGTTGRGIGQPTRTGGAPGDPPAGPVQAGSLRRKAEELLEFHNFVLESHRVAPVDFRRPSTSLALAPRLER